MDIDYTVRILNDRCENNRHPDFEPWKSDDLSYEEPLRCYCNTHHSYCKLCTDCQDTLTQFKNVAYLRKIDLEKLVSDVELIKSKLGLDD